jgi:recombination protein RecA
MTKNQDNLLHEVLESIAPEGAQLLGSKGLVRKIRGVISTQSPSVDAAIGRGGIPLARLTILHGKESCGKTTLALHIAAECQARNGIVVYMDKEYKLDPDYAKAIGVNTERLIISQPPYLEKVFKSIESIIQKVSASRRKTGERVPILVVLDSMNAAISKAEFEGDWDDQHYAPVARVFSKSLPKLMPAISKEDISLLFISQVREKMNVMFGDHDEIAGGRAPRHWASLILKINRLGATKKGDQKISNKIMVECVKNQISPPFKKAECDVVYGRGIDYESSLLWIAEKEKVVKIKGAYYTYESEKLGQGKEAACVTLRHNATLAEKIYDETRKRGRW